MGRAGRAWPRNGTTLDAPGSCGIGAGATPAAAACPTAGTESATTLAAARAILEARASIVCLSTRSGLLSLGVVDAVLNEPSVGTSRCCAIERDPRQREGHGNTVAAHSPGAVQSATVTMNEDTQSLLLPVAENLDGLLRANNLLGLDAANTEEALQVVSDLRRAAAESGVDGGVLRQLLQKAQTVAIAGTGSMMGQGVVALAHQALRGLGLS
jgi:hypothetical protein